MQGIEETKDSSCLSSKIGNRVIQFLDYLLIKVHWFQHTFFYLKRKKQREKFRMFYFLFIILSRKMFHNSLLKENSVLSEI